MIRLYVRSNHTFITYIIRRKGSPELVLKEKVPCEIRYVKPFTLLYSLSVYLLCILYWSLWSPSIPFVSLSGGSYYPTPPFTVYAPHS